VVVAVAAVLATGCLSEHGKSSDGGTDGKPLPTDAPFFPGVDAPPGNPGFSMPTVVLSAWTEVSSGSFDAAVMDLSCLGAQRSDASTTVPVTLSATVHDFQSGNLDPSTTVLVFRGTTTTNAVAMGNTNSSGVATLSIPTNVGRIGYQIDAPSSRRTFTFDALLAPSMSAQSVALEALSDATVSTLPALVGVSNSASKSIELGTITDCQGHTLSGAVATISSTSAFVANVPGVQTFYFSDSVDLPVRNSQAPTTTKNGKFMVIEIPFEATAFVQIWGFRSQSELLASNLTLIAELAVPVPSPAALITHHDPRATR
jgi:hypothetical protein